MELKIYNQDNELKLTVSPNTSSTVTEEVMGECAVSVGFTHTEFVMLDVNDYIDIEGVRYRIMAQYRPKQKNTQTYEYSVKFYAPIHQAENTLMLFTPDNEMTSEFAYDGGPREHLQLWIDNMNRIAGANVWQIGTVISAENKVIEYKNVKCWDAAFGSNGIAAAFDTEMWADGYYINLCKAERGERVDLGYLQGLTSLQQEENGEVKFFTRLFPLGSTRNIDASKYGHARLQLPGGVQFVDKNVDIYGVKEEFEEEAFSEIYPKYIGTVQSVRTQDFTSTEGRPYTVYFIKDTAMNFNPNDYEIPEYTKMIAFQTGELAGRGDDTGSFQANWHEDTKEWEIINTYPDEETQIPGGLIIPKAGDTYIPWNFSMPDEYIEAAELEYYEAVNNFLDEYSFDTNKYSGQTDRNHIENNNIHLMLGLNVRLRSNIYFKDGYKDTRITRVVRQLNDLYQATVTCTDKIGDGWKKSVDNSISSLKYEVAKSLEQTVIDIIKTGDTKTPSDSNVFSALKSIASFLRKDKEDATQYLIKFLGGLISDNIASTDFASGPFGTGYLIKKDPKTGKSYIEADEIYIRLKAYFDSLEIKHLSHVGGSIVLSPASMECNRVEVLSGEYETLFDATGSQLFDSQNDPLNAVLQGGEKVYRCYFNNSDGEKEIVNEFAIDDLAQCREFNVKEGTSQDVSNQYYWRRVVGLGDNYIDLSIDDCDEGSMIPKAGDTIVTIGNKTDVNRQKVVYISSYGEDAPSFKLYSGINSYSMLNKEVTVISPNEEKNVFTGKVVIKPGSAGFSNLTDAPNMTQINSDIKQAQQDASSAKEAVQDAKIDVLDLKSYVDGAFSDGIITEIEAKSIEKYINIVENTSQSARQSYEELFNNSHLVGSAKVVLSNTYSILESTINSLINSIETAIADGKTTVGEKQSVDNDYEDFNSAYSDFVRAVESANKSIQDKLKSYSDNAEIAAANAINDAAKAALDAMDAKKAVVNLNDYVDGAFSDGIISSSEAKAIEKYINIVTQTKKECDATYSVLYNNTFLIGTDKILLKLAKDAFDVATSNLILSIQSAITDGKSSSEEASDVNAKYSAFNAKYSALATAIENANKAIQAKIKEESVEEARVKSIEEANKLSQADKDLMAKNMGYKDYEDLENTAKRGEAIIQGGMLNIKLIQTEAIVTSSLIANAIKANSLNVNEKFIINSDGSVFTEGKHVSKGILTELSMDNGYLTINYMGEECFRLSVGSDGVPTIVMAHEGNVATISPYLLMFRDKSLKTLRIDPSKLGDGIINKKSDGTLFLDSYSNDNYINIHCSAGVGGKTYPYNGDYVVQEGSMDTVEAVPDAGYVFDSWSDGGAQSHNVVWVAGLRLTASFRPLVEKFTVSLVVEPANSGSTFGGGTEYDGTIKQISATANTGYRFKKWSDGGAQSHNVTWDRNKIITAYFEAYSYSDAELFPGSIFNNSSWESVVGTLSVQSSYVNFNISSDGTFMAKYGKGLFDRVLVQGVTYKFRVKLRGTEGETIMLVVASDDLLSDAKIITSVTLSTSSIATVPFESAVSSGDSSFSDQLYIIGSKNLTVYNISLKEWTL